MKACICDGFPDAPATFQDVVSRCEHAQKIAVTLDPIARDSSGWRSVERCRVCGALWTREYPFGEYHGGGSPCFYRISTADPAAWLLREAPLTPRLRTEHEQAAFLASLGPESGPEACRQPGCTHSRIGYSVFCRAHHAASLSAIRQSPGSA